jgi:PAS domain S-box-containing protein
MPLSLRLPAPPRLGTALGYLAALATPAVLHAAGSVIIPDLEVLPSLLFFPGIVVISYVGGMGPGSLAAVVSALLVNGPRLAFSPSSAFLALLVLLVGFILVGSASAVRAGHAKRARQERRLRSLVAATARMIWTTDARGEVVEDSPSWRAFTGQTREQRRGRGWLEAVHPEDRARAASVWEDPTPQRAPREAEYRVRRADGVWVPMVGRAAPVLDHSGAVVEWVGCNTELSERQGAPLAVRQGEERLHTVTELARSEAIAARDAFLSVASHELKTPLAAALLQIQQVRRLLERDALREHRALTSASAAEGSVARLGRVVDEILDAWRLSTGQLVLERARYDLSDVVLRSAVRFAEAARRAGSRLELSVEPGIWVDGDELRIEQAVTSLISNAVKYGAGHPISVGVQRDGARALLTVSDGGIGIATEDQHRIFERFERANSACHYGGLGLGLWMARRIVQASGGSILVTSAPGMGSTFTIDLPGGPVAAVKSSA